MSERIKIMHELDLLYNVLRIVKHDCVDCKENSSPIPIFSFEGLPGAGKTTQIKLVSEILSDKYGKCYYIDLPTKSKIGIVLKQLYSNLDSWKIIRKENPWLNPILISADLRIAVEKAIQNEAKFAIMSRGIISTYYYNLDAYNSNERIAWNMMKEHMNAFYKPTAIFFLDLSAEEANNRVILRNRGPLRQMDKVPEMKRDRERLISYIERMPDIPVHYINASGSEEEVTNRILEKMKGYIE